MDNAIMWKFLFYFLIAQVLLIVIFLICREIVCWYWKVNRIVELLENIENKLVNNCQLNTVMPHIRDESRNSFNNAVAPDYEFKVNSSKEKIKIILGAIIALALVFLMGYFFQNK